jgi:hypothetical protein
MVEYGLSVSTENCSRVLFPILNPNPCFGTLCSSKSNLVLSPRKLDSKHRALMFHWPALELPLQPKVGPVSREFSPEFLFIKTLIPVLGLCVLGF